jgi:hypothetical protein
MDDAGADVVLEKLDYFEAKMVENIKKKKLIGRAILAMGKLNAAWTPREMIKHAAFLAIEAHIGIGHPWVASSIEYVDKLIEQYGEPLITKVEHAMIVALAASAAYMTPVSSPTNTLVVSPGNYSFSDFVKVGAPFALVVMVISVVMVPWLLPLQ